MTNANNTHGLSRTSEYNCWCNMLSRCYNSKHPSYKNYGGRGIKVCKRWKNSFENFYADMGDRPEGKSLDRRNNDKGYLPRNCRWTTSKQQANNRRSKIKIEYRGKTQTLDKWARLIGIDRNKLWYRYYAGWRVSRLFLPSSFEQR